MEYEFKLNLNHKNTTHNDITDPHKWRIKTLYKIKNSYEHFVDISKSNIHKLLRTEKDTPFTHLDIDSSNKYKDLFNVSEPCPYPKYLNNTIKMKIKESCVRSLMKGPKTLDAYGFNVLNYIETINSTLN